jgi:hypothetical protein
MRREYERRPRLALTVPQAARLWSADHQTYAAALRALVRVEAILLTFRDDGRFARRDNVWQRRRRWCRLPRKDTRKHSE